MFSTGGKGNCLEATIKSKEKDNPTSMPTGEEVWEKKEPPFKKSTKAFLFLGESQILCTELYNGMLREKWDLQYHMKIRVWMMRSSLGLCVVMV